MHRTSGDSIQPHRLADKPPRSNRWGERKGRSKTNCEYKKKTLCYILTSTVKSAEHNNKKKRKQRKAPETEQNPTISLSLCFCPFLVIDFFLQAAFFTYISKVQLDLNFFSKRKKTQKKKISNFYPLSGGK